MAPLTDDKHDGIEYDRRFFHSFPRPKQGETSSLHLQPTEISAVPAYNPILYQQVDKGVEIVRVIHGARQWRDLL